MDIFDIFKESLTIEANAIFNSINHIDKSEVLKAVDIIYNTKGKVIVTGVGKSGHIGAKISATFSSTGTPSFFLHPTEALHGDLGSIAKDDSVIVISYSGNSDELIAIVPHIKRFGVKIITISSNENSKISSYSDSFIRMVIDKEACPLNIAPTSSTTLTLALADALAVCLMKKRNFSEESFASFHPAGSLGKRLYIKVKDIMSSKNLPISSKNSTLKDAIVIMSEGKLGNLFICNNGVLEGIFSDGDLRRVLLKDDFSLDDSVEKYMNKTPKCIDDDTIKASDALKIIEDNKIQILAIIDKKGVLKGAIHIHKLIEIGIKN